MTIMDNGAMMTTVGEERLKLDEVICTIIIRNNYLLIRNHTRLNICVVFMLSIVIKVLRILIVCLTFNCKKLISDII